jgi:hypothetical protein
MTALLVSFYYVRFFYGVFYGVDLFHLLLFLI